MHGHLAPPCRSFTDKSVVNPWMRREILETIYIKEMPFIRKQVKKKSALLIKNTALIETWSLN